VSDREWAHTTYGYMGSILLAVLVPDRYQEMIARGPEYGNDSIILGSHYAMDVLGGRTLAT
jgi:membrane-associated phospholipid phosphatase